MDGFLASLRTEVDKYRVGAVRVEHERRNLNARYKELRNSATVKVLQAPRPRRARDRATLRRLELLSLTNSQPCWPSGAQSARAPRRFLDPCRDYPTASREQGETDTAAEHRSLTPRGRRMPPIDTIRLSWARF